MPEDPSTIGEKLGMLLERTAHIITTVEKLDGVTDIIRTDQTNARREIDFMKSMVKDTREMTDEMAPTIKNQQAILDQHASNFKEVMPLLPAMQDIDQGLRRGKKAVGLIGVVAVSPYGSSFWGWLKPVIHWPWL